MNINMIRTEYEIKAKMQEAAKIRKNNSADKKARGR